MKTLFITAAITLTSLFASAQTQVIAYHMGNTNELTGMLSYARQHNLKLDKSEYVNNVVLNYFSPRTIVVQSGKTVVKLDANRVAYVLSRTKNVSVRQALTNGMQTIRNNGQADIICAILKGKRN